MEIECSAAPQFVLTGTDHMECCYDFYWLIELLPGEKKPFKLTADWVEFDDPFSLIPTKFDVNRCSDSIFRLNSPFAKLIVDPCAVDSRSDRIFWVVTKISDRFVMDLNLFTLHITLKSNPQCFGLSLKINLFKSIDSIIFDHNEWICINVTSSCK